MEKPKRINIKITLSVIVAIPEDCLAYYQDHEPEAIEALCMEEEKSVITVEVVEDEAQVDWYTPAIEEREGADPDSMIKVLKPSCRKVSFKVDG